MPGTSLAHITRGLRRHIPQAQTRATTIVSTTINLALICGPNNGGYFRTPRLSPHRTQRIATLGRQLRSSASSIFLFTTRIRAGNNSKRDHYSTVLSSTSSNRQSMAAVRHRVLAAPPGGRQAVSLMKALNKPELWFFAGTTQKNAFLVSSVAHAGRCDADRVFYDRLPNEPLTNGRPTEE